MPCSILNTQSFDESISWKRIQQWSGQSGSDFVSSDPGSAFGSLKLCWNWKCFGSRSNDSNNLCKCNTLSN